jgi:hypothetical protein
LQVGGSAPAAAVAVEVPLCPSAETPNFGSSSSHREGAAHLQHTQVQYMKSGSLKRHCNETVADSVPNHVTVPSPVAGGLTSTIEKPNNTKVVTSQRPGLPNVSVITCEMMMMMMMYNSESFIAAFLMALE